MADDQAVLGVDDGLLDGRADGEDRGVGHVDDAEETGDAVHAEVGDREGRTRHLVRRELLRAGLADEGLRLDGDVLQRLGVRVADDRGDQAVFEGDAEGEVHRAVGADARAGPGGVDRGDAAKGFGGSLQDEVVDRELDRVGAGFGEALVQRFAHRHERSGVDFDLEVEVRDGDLGLEEPAGDRLAHAAHRDVGVRLDALAVGGRSDRDVERAGRSGDGRSRSGGGDIATDDAATGAGAGEGGDVERGLLGHALGVR